MILDNYNNNTTVRAITILVDKKKERNQFPKNCFAKIRLVVLVDVQ